jgi:hypothetical protein
MSTGKVNVQALFHATLGARSHGQVPLIDRGVLPPRLSTFGVDSRVATRWTAPPLTISRVLQNIKWISARSLNENRRASGPVWQHQFWDRFVRHHKEFIARSDYMQPESGPEGVGEQATRVAMVRLQ